MKTIAQQLNVKEFPFEIKDTYGRKIYEEYSNGLWFKSEYDSEGRLLRFENSEDGVLMYNRKLTEVK